MRDVDIRRTLHAALAAQHDRDSDTRVVNELGLCQGVVRVDIAVVNGTLSGYEIKSLADTLKRLPFQAEVYSQVLDFATIVLAERHRKEAVAMVPRWWGVTVALETASGDELALSVARQPKRNRGVNKRALAELLWHQDALEMLCAAGAERGLKSRPRAAAWDRVCEVFSTEAIADAVRGRIKDRARQQAASQQTPGDGECQCASTTQPRQTRVC